LRTVTFDVPPQEILTKDSVTCAVDGVVYFRIFDPVASVNNVSNAKYSTQLLAATSLRNILGTKTLQEILTDKDQIATMMKVSLVHLVDLFKIVSYFIIIIINFRRLWMRLQMCGV
jgi:erythrocyte band 7 integral membrane protein